MKYLKFQILFFVVCSLFSFTYLDDLNPFDNNKKIKGKVKSLISIHYLPILNSDNKNINGEGRNILYTEIKNFDKNGNLLTEISKKPDGRYAGFYGKINHSYDEKNNIIDSKYLAEDSSNNFKMVYKYFDGILIERYKYNFIDILENKTFYYYNDSLFVTLEMCLDSDNKLAYFFRYEYDIKGRVTEFIFHNERHGEGQTSSKKKFFKYDKKGRRIKDISFDINGNLMVIVNYYYNNKNQITKIASSTIDRRKKYIRKYKYDPNGLIISCESEKSEFRPKMSYTYKYENFDKIGNWLKKITFKDGKLSDVTERQIEYYD